MPVSQLPMGGWAGFSNSLLQAFRFTGLICIRSDSATVQSCAEPTEAENDVDMSKLARCVFISTVHSWVVVVEGIDLKLSE